MSIKTKFLVLSALTALIIIAQLVVNQWGRERAIAMIDIQSHIALITQRHMEGDMMHDAIRADVLAAIVAMHNEDAEGVQVAENDLIEHGNNFRDNIKANMQAKTSPAVTESYQKGEAALEAYIAAGRRVIDSIQAGEPFDRDMAQFEAGFENLEAANEATTNHILAWSDYEKKVSRATKKKLGLISNVAGGLSIGAIILLPLMVVLLLLQPQARLIRRMNSIAENNFDVEVPGLKRHDEIGVMARAVEVFKKNGIARKALEAEQEKARAAEAAEAEKRAERAMLAQSFAERMQSIISTVASSATELFQTSEQMGTAIRTASARVGNVSSATHETTASVKSVATATNELTSTVREIAQQITRSTENIRSAVDEVTRADSTAISLGKATEQIGQIVDVIQSIASQINLLALNATIESARAGEAGKGFAVVAGEVKTLATQTSQATAEIANNITSIQTVSQQVIQALATIKTTIANIDEISTAISAAVEEQNATTNHIAQSMDVAARNTVNINQDISEVSSATTQSSAAASQVLDSARMLSKQAEELRSEVNGFLEDLNAA